MWDLLTFGCRHWRTAWSWRSRPSCWTLKGWRKLSCWSTCLRAPAMGGKYPLPLYWRAVGHSLLKELGSFTCWNVWLGVKADSAEQNVEEGDIQRSHCWNWERASAPDSLDNTKGQSVPTSACARLLWREGPRTVFHTLSPADCQLCPCPQLELAAHRGTVRAEQSSSCSFCNGVDISAVPAPVPQALSLYLQIFVGWKYHSKFLLAE